MLLPSSHTAHTACVLPPYFGCIRLCHLQGELLQQMAVNRSRLGVVLQAALDDMPQQQQRSTEFAAWEADINAYHAAVREAKKAAKRERREAERRAAQVGFKPSQCPCFVSSALQH
jgi:hypothetical protein